MAECNRGKIGFSGHAAARHPETMKKESGLSMLVGVSPGQGRLCEGERGRESNHADTWQRPVVIISTNGTVSIERLQRRRYNPANGLRRVIRSRCNRCTSLHRGWERAMQRVRGSRFVSIASNTD